MHHRFQRPPLMILCSVALACLAATEARAEKKVHLFILSGQSNMRNLDPSASFTPTVTEALAPGEVIVVKDAHGGQPIHRWYKQWKLPAGSESPKNKYGDLYDKLMRKVRRAIEGKKPDTITFIWMQGESDAAELFGEIYAESMSGLIEQLRNDLKRRDINVVIGRISDAGNGNTRFKHWDQVRAAQVKVAESDPRTVWIDTDDLNGKKNGVHYNKPGYVELGKRFAEAALKLLNHKLPAKTPDPRTAQRTAKDIHLFILSGQSNMAGMNPDLSFTPTVAEALGPDEVIVVKDAQGGQPIRRWYKQWKPPAGLEAPKGPNGDLYDRLMKKVRPAIKGKKLQTITFLWMQGERDARERYGQVYAASMSGLIEQLRTDLKRPDMNVVIGRLSDFSNGNTRYEHWDQVRAAQMKAAEADPRATWIDTDDLNGEKNDLHYDNPGYVELGKRFAEAALELLKGKSPALTPEPQTARWAQRWWMPRHKQKLDQINKAERIDLVFIGDSITHGWEKSGGKPTWDQYYAKRHALNLGYGGDRTEQVIWRMQNGEADGYKAKLAVIMIGTNNAGHRQDPPAAVAEGIRAILDEWQIRQPQSKVLLLGIFPRGAKPDDDLRKINEKVNKLISQFDDGERVFYLDIGARFLSDDGALPQEIMRDRLHPDAKGYRIWAEAIEPTVRKLLGED